MATTAGAQELGQSLSLGQQFQVAALAQAPAGTPTPTTPAPAPEPAAKKVTTTIGADVPLLTGYVFRGIVQEGDPKFTIQPFVDFGIAASPTVTINVGTWNSFHSGSNKDAGSRGAHAWYESDIYGQATFVAGKWKPAVLFTAYTSPADVYKTVSEFAGILMYDDSAMSMPLSPKIILAFETSDASADGGDSKGVYLEAGVKPVHKAGAATIGIPIKLGLSLKDYYQGFKEDGSYGDNKFGYFDIGANVSVPLSGMKMGAWEAHGGLDFYVFGKNRKVQQEGDDEPKSVKPVLSFGFSAIF
ncbi:MAG: hypothetical protein ABI652_05440 [Acidobacteriota bacterium]